MIKEIDNEIGKNFLINNKAQKEHISITDAELWIGYFYQEELVGVISKITIGKISRIKCFYVKKEFRNQGIGYSLLEEMLKYCNSKCSAFATESSYPIFKKFNFVEKEKKPITFMTKNT